MPEQSFDFDKYLAEKQAATVQANSFDMDKYLAEKSGAAKLDPNKPFGDTAQNAAEGLRTGVRSGLEMLSLGASEPVFAGMHGVNKAWQNITQVDASGKPLQTPTDIHPLDALKAGYNEDVAQRRADKENHGVADVVGGVGGALVPAGPAAALIGKATGLIGRGANAARAALPEINATSKLGKAIVAGAGGLGKIAESAASGAATGYAAELPRQAIEGASGFIQHGDANVPDLGDVGKVGAVIGGSIPAAGMVLRGAGKVAGATGVKLLSSFLGPSEAHIEYYMKNPGAVNGAKSLEELKDHVDSITEGLRREVEGGKISVSEAQAQIKDVQQAVMQNRAESNFDYQVTATQVRQALRDAREELSKAYEGKVNALKNIKAPTDLADEAVQATRDLRGKVSEGSKEASELLANDVPGASIDTTSPYKALQAAKDRLSVAGKGPITPQAKAAAAEIDKLMQAFGSLPSKMTESETKALIQQIDRSEEAVYNSGEYTDDVSRAYKDVRQALDRQLKAGNPAYAERMEGVAADRQLHEDVLPKFGDRGSAISTLNRVASPTAQVEREGLLKLGQATGRDFQTPVEEFTRAQGILKSPEAMQRIEQSLPEHGRMLEAEKASRMLEGPEAKNEFVTRRLQDSGLLGKQSEAEGLLAKRQGLLEGAQQKAEPFSNMTPKTSEGRLKVAMNAKPGEQLEHIRQLEQLSKLSKMPDTDFVKALEDLKTKQVFEGTRVQGSRRVNLFAIVMGGLGGALGGVSHGTPGISMGMAAGGALGAIADHYGGPMTKKILDGALKIQEIAGKAGVDASAGKLAANLPGGRTGEEIALKIKSLDLPPEAKAFLSREFADFQAASAVAGPQKKNQKDASSD